MTVRSGALITLSLAMGCQAIADDSQDLCAANSEIIEKALKSIARELSALPGEELSASIGQRRMVMTITPPTVIASGWAQIEAAQQHMAALSCKPHKLPIDPTVYYDAAKRCQQDASKERASCDVEKWARSSPKPRL